MADPGHEGVSRGSAHPSASCPGWPAGEQTPTRGEVTKNVGNISFLEKYLQKSDFPTLLAPWSVVISPEKEIILYQKFKTSEQGLPSSNLVHPTFPGKQMTQTNLKEGTEIL